MEPGYMVKNGITHDDFFVVGSCPIDENCVSVSSEKPYMREMILEVKRFQELLETRFEDFDLIGFRTIRFAHDFGPYLEVVCTFRSDNKESEAQMLAVENFTPRTWDDNSPILWDKVKRDYYTPFGEAK